MRRYFFYLTLFLTVGCAEYGRYFVVIKGTQVLEQFSGDQIKFIGGAQRKTTKVDMLFIIDNSGSMQAHQNNVIANMNAFIDKFTQAQINDYSLALISTDFGGWANGFNPYIVTTSAESTAVADFKNAVSSLGIMGSAQEEIFPNLKMFTQQRRSFIRNDALFAVFMVTDAAPQAFSILGGGKSYLDDLVAAGIDLNNVVVNGALAGRDLPGNQSCTITEAAYNYVGSAYEEAIKGTGGQVVPFCGNFADAFVSFATSTVIRAQSAYVILSAPGVPNSIQVFNNGKQIPYTTQVLSDGRIKVFLNPADFTGTLDINYKVL